jgi:hypothetical protein
MFTKKTLKTAAILAHDRWLDLCTRIYNICMAFLVYFIKNTWSTNNIISAVLEREVGINNYDTSNLNNLNDLNNPNTRHIDVTYLVRWFYIIDSLCSVASMYRWLSKFVPIDDDSHICINMVYFNRNLLKHSRINLLEDQELLTDQSVPYASMELHNLPHLVVK